MPFPHRHSDDEPRYDITGVAISNNAILVVSSIGFGLLGFVLYFFILRRLSTADELAKRQANSDERDSYGEMLDQTDVATLNRAQRKARAKFRAKKVVRAAAPVWQADADGDAGDNDGAGELRDNHDGNLTRKERRKAAKDREKEELKGYSKEAREWREKRQAIEAKSDESDISGAKEEIHSGSRHDGEIKVPLEEIVPRRQNEGDALSEYLFWAAILKNIKEQSTLYEEMVSTAQQIEKITVREFIERLKLSGSVSISALVKEFGGGIISVSDAIVELEHVNREHGIIGIIDSKGNFVHVSMDMIKQAVKRGQDARIITCPW